MKSFEFRVLSYPFRPSDSNTQEIGALFDTLKPAEGSTNTYVYSNPLEFNYTVEVQNQPKAPTIYETIETTKDVYIKEDVKFDNAILIEDPEQGEERGKLIRYNKADYKVKDDGQYKETKCDEWIIDDQVEFKNGNDELCNIKYSATESQNMTNPITDNNNSIVNQLFFGEQTLIVKNGNETKYGKLVCAVLTLTNCPKVTVEGKSNEQDSRDGTISCTKLII